MTSLAGARSTLGSTVRCAPAPIAQTAGPMPSSAVCSITDPLESIKARVDASLAKMDAANGQTQRARRPRSAQVGPPSLPPRQPPPSRPSTAFSSGPATPFRSRSTNAAPPRPPGVATNASRDLLAYARQRFESVVVAEDREENESRLLSAINSPSGLSAASHQSHLTSKTLVSAYVTLTSPSIASGRSAPALPALRPAQKEQHELRLRLLNEIRVRAEKQTVRMRHDRVAQELCQEGGLPSRTAVYPYRWPEVFRWRVEPQPRFERERRAAQEQFERRLAAAPELPEPEKEEEEEKKKEPVLPEGKGKRRTRGPPSVSSIGSTEKRKVRSAVRRVEREVSKLKAEAKRRAEAEAARLAEEEAAAAAEAGELGPAEAVEDAAAERANSLPVSGPEDDAGLRTEANEEEEQEPCSEEVPDFLCPSSEEKSRQHEVRLWLRKTTYSNAPDFLPIY